ncbi:MAG TPA: SRPBCC family protein [Nocardioides sp.]|nr:SRPBCC family protein [Nocardioides sp.]
MRRPSVAYEFRGTWSVAAPLDAVREAAVDLEHYPEWWPQIRAVVKLGPDDARVLCRSTLPYTLDLVLHAVSREGSVLEVEVSGDLDGSVRWELTPEDGGTRMDFEQQVVVRGALAVVSYVGRPLLQWNHHRMMLGCIAGLRERLRDPMLGGSTTPT